MTNFDVCVCFVNGTKNGAHSLSMSISDNGDRLYSYGTVIAQKLQNGAIILNDTKYSVTTSKHQNEIRYAIRMYAQTLKIYQTEKNKPRGTYDITRYYTK